MVRDESVFFFFLSIVIFERKRKREVGRNCMEGK